MGFRFAHHEQKNKIGVYPQKTHHMNKYFFLLVLFLSTIQIAYSQQSIRSSRKGAKELILSANILPVNLQDKRLSFIYFDGAVGDDYVLDVINAGYDINPQRFNTGFTIGGAYYLADKLKMSLSATPHFNSFASNKNKNGRTYGAQFDLGLDYSNPITPHLSLTGGVGLTRIIGGFGITSGGPNNKTYLVVNGNELHDDDIGFHIIDNSWATTLQTGLEYGSNRGRLFFKVGYQIPFQRTSRMNFAGTLEDDTVKWNRKSYEDANLSLSIDGQPIQNNTIKNLPFRFGGLVAQVGVIAHFRKRT
jgi:hypothetical protein